MAKTISADDLEMEITQAIKNYTDDVIDAIEKEVDDTADKVRDDARATAPKKTGKYAKGISKKTERRHGEVTKIIYNKNKPGLAHLLEFGHAKRGGGRVAARPHLRPAYDRHVPRMEKNIEKIIRNGG